MGLPGFNSAAALYRSTNVYREYAGGSDPIENYGTQNPSSPVRTPQGKTICAFIENGVPVNNCPVYKVGCDPPACKAGETCCFERTVHEMDATYNYYSCANFQTDNSNCGVCGKVCGIGDICCKGSCVSTTSPGYSCETCGCLGGMTCQNGVCQCPSNLTNCGGQCTNIENDSQNCGSCGNACPEGPGTTTTCQNGKCQCSGYGDIICNGSCTNPYGDSKNCGACGHACPSGTCCNLGSCTSTNVQTDPNNCGTCGNTCSSFNCCSEGKCADVLTDVKNCGTCGNVCPNGYTCCEGNCVDFQNDPNNCGSCNNSCGNFTCCRGTCVDTYLNPSDCGSCGHKCANQCCSSGSCADFSNDPNNCGSCRNSCNYPQASCYNGCCVNGAPLLNSANTSNTNYWVGNQNSCLNMPNPTVVVQVGNQPLFSPNGFSFQLNAVPPPGNSPGITWMQYSFGVSNGDINGWVEYWGDLNNQDTPNGCIAFSNQDLNVACCSNGDCCSGWDSFWDPIFGGACQQVITSIPSNTIPAGYALEVSLATDPNSGNVTQANFGVIDNHGDFTSFGVPIPGYLQVPVQAFQFVAVGLNGGQTAAFSKGGGTLTYLSQPGELCVLGATIPCSAANIYSGFTGETSNATYGNMNACCGLSLKQSFST